MPRKRERVKKFIRGLLGDKSVGREAASASQSVTPPQIANPTNPEHIPMAAPVPLPSMLDSSIRPASPPVPDIQPENIEDTPQPAVSIPVVESATYEGWTGLKTLAAVLSKTPECFGPLKHAADVLVSFIETFEKMTTNRSEFQDIKQKLDILFNDLQKYLDTPVSPTMTSSIKNIAEGIKQETDLIEQMQEQNAITRYLNSEQDVDEVLKSYRRIEGLFQRLTLNANLGIWKTVDDLSKETYLNALPNSPPAYYRSPRSSKLNRGSCTQDTRIDVLREIHEWASGTSPEKIYWLNGMAGTGKTTIAYSLCQELEKKQALAASFFCSRQLPDCRDVNRILATIAYQLSRYSSPFSHVLCSLLGEDRDVCNKPILDQFELLIMRAVNKTKSSLPNNLVVVIDALDECEAETGVADILDVLLAHAPDLPLKFFVSSRPSAKILDRMRQERGDRINTEMRLHELDDTVVKTDIMTYLTTALQPSIAISSTELSALVERSGVLFIYASTVVRYVGDDNFARGTKRLKEVINTPKAASLGSNMEIDELYRTILRSALGAKTLTETDRNEMRLIVHTVVCAQEPLLIETMAGLLRLDSTGSVNAALRPLFSVLQVSNTRVITTLHESFRDFLLDPSRSREFHCNLIEHNARLAELCFYHMSVPRSFNICGLQSSYLFDRDVPALNETLKAAVTGELFYSCCYWDAHVKLNEDSTSLAKRLLEFLSRHLLIWMEVMNSKGVIAHGIEMLRGLEGLPEESMLLGMETKELVQDGCSFMVAYSSSPIRLSTPHIYVSALLFWPTTSTMRRHYRVDPLHVIGSATTANTVRGVVPLAIITSSQAIYCMAFSPNGQHILIAGSDNYSQIWSIQNGQWLGQRLEGHTSSITSVAYSPDSAYIASGSHDRTVRIWDAYTGKQVGPALEGHTGFVTSVAYSPDSAYLVSGSHDRTVRIWDAHTGKQVGPALEGHTDWVTSVAYSPDSAYLVSGSHDRTVRIWDAHTGKQVGQALEGHTDWVTSVACSPDSAYIVSGSYDSTVRIWDAHTGKQVGQALEGHTDWVRSVAYSPDSAYIVSGSDDRTVCIWDAHTSRQVGQTLEGHTEWVASVAYSPDSAYIVSGSHDRTVRIWDAHTGKQVGQALEGHIDSVRSVAYSPDSAYIASGSHDRTVRIWDAHTGKQVGPALEGHTDWVTSVAYSPDSAYLVSGSHDRTVRIWDAHTGKQVGQALEGHTDWVTSVAYSPDSVYIVSGSDDRTVRIWDAHTGKQVGQALEGHTDPVRSVTYSPDSAYIVSGSNDNTVRIWDAHTGKQVGQALEGHTGSVRSVAYSPDSAYLVSGSYDRTVRIWDAHTGKQVGPALEGHTAWVRSVAYSPDSAYIVSGSDDNTMRIWDAHTGKQVGQALEGHTMSVTSVAYSPDSASIVSGSNDNTIRVWKSEAPKAADQLASTLLSGTLPLQSSHTVLHPALHQQPGFHICASACQIQGPHRSWTVNDDGWAVLPSGELLFWIPPDLRTTLLRPENSCMASSRRGVLYLNPDPTIIGDCWAEHFNPFKTRS